MRYCNSQRQGCRFKPDYWLTVMDSSYFLSSRKSHNENTVVKIGSIDGEDVFVGSGKPVVIAGPCVLEDEQTSIGLALKLKQIGVKIFRAMLFKPRTSPYSFQGMDRAGIPILKKIKQATGLILVTEVREIAEAEATAPYTDVFQIGTRNMSNFNLLKQVGKMQKPVLIKRGMGATIEELLCAAEYILAEGNQNVILCERGIRTFENYTRFTLDISAIPAVKELSHLPIIADPSHASGKSSLVIPLAKASIAAGADGVMIEVHEHPSQSKSDPEQAITPKELENVMLLL